jgi:2-keto-4-pentenoate hydratase/2-oxohepta-3-ene-1,7-dioic acid hydratase in catechol pathway
LLKLPSCLAASGAAVRLPGIAHQYDYEGELAFVVGRRARNVAEADALDHIWGYTNCNDIHARDLHPFSFGKLLDGFLPVGPTLVSADEVGDPQSLDVRTWLNGELRQDGHTSDMVFGVAELLSYISRHVTLEVGDIVATGTPAGLIIWSEDKAWMKAGDRVEVEVGPLGRLETPLIG